MADLTREQIEDLLQRCDIVVRRFGDDTDPAHVFVQMPVDRIQALCTMALRAIDAEAKLAAVTAERDRLERIAQHEKSLRCVADGWLIRCAYAIGATPGPDAATTGKAAEAKIAEVAAQFAEWSERHSESEVAVQVARAERAERALAQALAAMPTAEDVEDLSVVLYDYSRKGSSTPCDPACVLRLVALCDRLDAFRASHEAGKVIVPAPEPFAPRHASDAEIAKGGE